MSAHALMSAHASMSAFSTFRALPWQSWSLQSHRNIHQLYTKASQDRTDRRLDKTRRYMLITSFQVMPGALVATTFLLTQWWT